jgi:hypothetical protein
VAEPHVAGVPRRPPRRPHSIREHRGGKPGAWRDPAITTALQQIQDLVKRGAFGTDFNSVNYVNDGAGLLFSKGKVLSFTTWNGLGSPAFNGLDNWSRLLSDRSVLDSLRISAVLTVLCWLTQTPLALLLGVWAAGRQRNRAVLSSIFFLPLLMCAAAIAITWLTLLDLNFGLAAKFGPYIGFPDGNLIGSPRGTLEGM